MNKKIIIATVIFLFLIFIFFLTKCSGDLKIKFFDEKNGELLAGFVYIDDELVGETDGFFELPKEYCNEEHKIKLTNDDLELEWDILPEDCKLDQLVLRHVASKKISRKLLFSFLDKDTNQSISGKLFFDGEPKGETNGNYTIKREDCRMIGEINLATNDETFAWQYDNGLCNKNEVIEFFS